MATKAPPPNSAFLAPRFWPTWLGIGTLCCIAWLPFRLRMAAGAVLGWLTWLFARERRYITEVNIRLCFPELDAPAQAALVRAAFIENGIGLIETATGWIRPAQHFRHMAELRGADVLAAAVQQGKGVLLLGGHYSTLDFSANLLSLFQPFAVTYRAHGNPLFDAFMLRGRLRNCNGVFDRKDIRGAFRHLREGKVLWYAPDQDYGPEQAVYAPWFGRTAATITAGSRFAAFNDSAVLVVSHRRITGERRYILDMIPLEQAFPGADDVADATLVNGMIEREIRKAPAQYLWMHKRFKTQPGGKPESPYIFIKTPCRRLSAHKYSQLLEGAQPVADQPLRQQLASGLQLWCHRGQPALLRRHPLLHLDRISKQLRQHQVSTVTVDSLYVFPHLDQSAATVFVPAGARVDTAAAIPPAAAADFLLRLHACGCSFLQMPAGNLLWDGSRLALLDPQVLQQEPGSAALHARRTDCRQLAEALHLDASARALYLQCYLDGCRPALRQNLAAQLLADAALPPHNARLDHGSP